MTIPHSTHSAVAAPSPSLSGGYIQPLMISPGGAGVALLLAVLACHRLGMLARQRYQVHQMAVLLQHKATLERLLRRSSSPSPADTHSFATSQLPPANSQPSGDR